MQARGFLSSLFDYSFRSFITSRIIKVLYILSTIVVALETLTFILLAFRASSTAGILMLIIGGPIFFLLSMIWVRVVLELIIVFFRIHEDVREINVRAGGGIPVAPSPSPAPAPHSVAPPEPLPPSEPEPEPGVAHCSSCGREVAAGGSFCRHCGATLVPATAG